MAAMEKILENTYRNVNIGLINEIGRLCNEMEISVWEVIDATKTKPYGFQAFYPWPGLGGHCIPLDPYYLSCKAREFGFHTTLVENSMVINDSQPSYCAGRARNILNRMGKATKGARILVIGVAYKQDIDDCRESASIHLIQELKKVGAEVDFYDPYVKEYHENRLTCRSLDTLEAATIKEHDLVIIATAHTNIDYQLIQENASFIFDTRNATRILPHNGNIEVL